MKQFEMQACDKGGDHSGSRRTRSWNGESQGKGRGSLWRRRIWHLEERILSGALFDEERGRERGGGVSLLRADTVVYAAQYGSTGSIEGNCGEVSPYFSPFLEVGGTSVVV